MFNLYFYSNQQSKFKYIKIVIFSLSSIPKKKEYYMLLVSIWNIKCICDERKFPIPHYRRTHHKLCQFWYCAVLKKLTSLEIPHKSECVIGAWFRQVEITTNRLLLVTARRLKTLLLKFESCQTPSRDTKSV